VPGCDDVAMGAITTGGVEFWDRSTLAAFQVPAVRIDDVVRRERAELARCECAYRGVRPFPVLHGKTVLIVDDGIATAFTMQAAIRAVELKRPRSIVIAAPVASSEAVQSLSREAAAVITVVTSERTFTVGDYYRDFRDTTDEEIRAFSAHSPDDEPSLETAA
jgi:putative phosphoribosyl transferase